jgi:hypothetical protein
MSAREAPIPYYDQLATGSIEAQLRDLEPDQLHELLGYETEYGGRRRRVLELIRMRLEAVPRPPSRRHA